MIGSARSKHRVLIPRWRPLAVTIRSGELFAPAFKHASWGSPHVARELLRRLERWRLEPELVTAAELLETAIIYGKETEAASAARLLARPNSGATDIVREQAEHVLSRIDPSAIDAKPPLTGTDRSMWRTRIKENPRDALAWVELALHQVYARRLKAAERSMRVALQIAPENRHVLRSAVRLFHHIDETDHGFQLIHKSGATPGDPWLMAAEIALATRLEKPSRFIKKGLALLAEDNHRPRQITELAGAAATTISLDGNRKRGRRLFKESMADPTGNSLAQAQWAEQSFDEELISEGQLERTFDAKEARAVQKYEAGQFEQALTLAREWIRDEPFSSRGYRLGAAAASVVDDAKQIEEFARTGLRYEPKSGHLLNSLAFSLALQGLYHEAKQTLREIQAEIDDRALLLVSEANRGLIAMRQEDLARGDELYRKAISGFRQLQEQRAARIAMAYYAREAVQAKHPRALELVAEAKHGLVPELNRIAVLVLKQAEGLLMPQAADTAADPHRRNAH